MTEIMIYKNDIGADLSDTPKPYTAEEIAAYIADPTGAWHCQCGWHCLASDKACPSGHRRPTSVMPDGSGRWLATVDELRADLERLRGENMCDACVGGRPISGIPCMCGGSGKMSDAARYLREQVVKLEAKVQAEHAEFADAYWTYAAETERLRSEVAELTESNADLDSTCSSMVSARDLTIRDLRFDLKLMTQDRDSGNEALAASAEALRVERERHARDIEATMLDARAAFDAATKTCREQLREVCRVLEANDIEAADCAADRVMARVRELTADNERLRAALHLCVPELENIASYSGAAGNWPLQEALTAASKALAPTPTGGKEHE